MSERGLSHSIRATGAGWAAGFGRIASIIAPLCVPPLLNAGGSEAVFGTFAVFFGVAIIGAPLLPEWKGRHLAEDAVT